MPAHAISLGSYFMLPQLLIHLNSKNSCDEQQARFSIDVLTILSAWF
jgi:hypothetical protein